MEHRHGGPVDLRVNGRPLHGDQALVALHDLSDRREVQHAHESHEFAHAVDDTRSEKLGGLL